jgi:hypothetical protein
MTTISGPVKPVDDYPDASQATTAYADSVIGFFEAGRPRSLKSEGAGKGVEIAQGHREAVYWLFSLAALISLLVGVPCLLEPATPRTADTDQLNLAAEGAPSHVEVTIGEAIQVLSIRH